MRILFIVIWSALAANIWGQVSVTAELPDSLFIGDKITVKFAIDAPQDQIASIDFSNWGVVNNQYYRMDTGRYEEYLDLGISAVTDSLQLPESMLISGGSIPRKGSFQLTLYSEGKGVLPAPRVMLKDSTYLDFGNSLDITCHLPEGFQMNAENIHDIKTIRETTFSWKDLIPTMKWIGIGLLGMILLYNVFKRLRKKEEEVEEIVEEVIVIPPHTLALNALNDLDKRKVWQSGDVKAYQSELTDIMRQYIENRYNVNALEMTTGEIKSGLKKAGVQSTLVDKLLEILQIADIVKFAKGEVRDELNQQFMEAARQWVNDTKLEVVEE